MDPATLIRRSARTFEQNTAIVVDRDTQTYGQMFDRACRLANALRGLGVTSGDTVAVLGDNCIEALEQVAACALGNYPRATLYTYHSAEINAYLLDHVEAKALLVDAKNYEALSPYLEQVDVKNVLVYGQGVPDGVLSYEQQLVAASPDDVVVPCREDDVHIIRFSSGTTGKPKGIYHTIGRWMAFNNEYRWVTPMMDENSSYLVAGALAHFGVALLWSLLPVGGRVVLMPSFDAENALKLIEQHRVTHVTAVPIMVKAMVDHPTANQRDLSSLRCLLYAGSPIAETTLQSAMRLFGSVLFQVYAQSEVLLMTTLQPYQHTEPDADNGARGRLQSTGRSTPNVVLTVRDENGDCVPAGTIGEIAAISPGSMSGIWKDAEATAARTLGDGSILTRDMGYLDEDGFLFLVDRKDDMIVSGGYNIWPSELEIALADYPGVMEVCVIGIPDEKWGETPKAFVVATSDEAPTADELIAYTRDRVGPVKKVTLVEFVSELPKSGSGKVLRGQLKATHWEDTTRLVRGQ